MGAPLKAAGVRTAGPRLTKRELSKTADVQLARKDGLQIANNQSARNVPTKTNDILTKAQENGSISSDLNIDNPKISKADLVGQKLNKKQKPDEIKQEILSEEYIDDNIDPELFIEEERQIAEKRKLLKGVDYFLILLVVIAKDIFDVINEILSFVFDILVVTSPIGILQYIISTVADFTVLMITQGYFLINKVKMSRQKASIQGFSTLIEMIPFLGLLPINTISFVYLCNNINKERKAEEIEEQKKLDEEWMSKIEEKNKRIEAIRKNTSITSIKQKQETIKKESISKKNNAWQEMVDNSNQNITKSAEKQK